ncbi:biotin-dependent carboxyltransferase family protein [Zavarzinia sp. CC-PAN008]|uniref:5-oxoprolinase subunit C family protein n=1 Tax=Zavarzinia sp. CC-PAN008 TaxID=3243332 RepID=UPI003F743C57
MPVLNVLEAGPATSIQDAGRRGVQRYGVAPAGAMDRLGLACANALVGSAIDAAAIELGPFPARVQAEGGPVRLSLAGAAREAAVDGRVLAPGTTITLEPGQVLALRAARGGVFSYVGIAGGLDAAPILGSLSVQARAGLGSPFGRPLRSGDRLPLLPLALVGPERTLALPPPAEGPLRVVLGPQDDHFTDDAIALLQATDWRISALSDRMGCRLEGPTLAHRGDFNIVSDGSPLGAIQVPGNGLPLVLLADRGTTGGYPKIAVIITPDLPRFVQAPVGSTVRFQAVDVAHAQAAARAFAQRLAALPEQVTELRGPLLSSEALLAQNLAGDAVDALAPLA